MGPDAEAACTQNLLWEDEGAAKFICHRCQKTFYNMTALQNHRKVHHDTYNYNCQQEQNVFSYGPNDETEPCNFNFIPSTPSTFRRLFTVNGLTTCEFLEDTSFLIVKHKRAHSGRDAMKILPLPSESNSNNDQNKMSVDLRGPFACTFRSSLDPNMQCQKIFFDCCEYSLHYREEHTKRRKAALRCQVCEKRLDCDTYLNKTIGTPFQSVFTKLLNFSCPLCSQNFLDRKQYEEHNRIFHSKTKCHVCSICAKSFSHQGGLQQHMRMHTGVRPFICSFCQKGFTQKAGLEQHVRTHTKVKPFRCVVCSKCFSQSVHLRQHMRTHTNIQPFECSICGKTFKQSSHLNFHMRSHMTESSCLLVERYAQKMQLVDQVQLLNVQPVLDGETMYYAAELPAPAAQLPAPTTQLPAPADQQPQSAPRFFPFAYHDI